MVLTLQEIKKALLKWENVFLWVYLLANCLNLNHLWLQEGKKSILSVKLLSHSILCHLGRGHVQRKSPSVTKSCWTDPGGATSLLGLGISWNTINHTVQQHSSGRAIFNRKSTKIQFSIESFRYLAAPSGHISNSFSLEFPKFTWTNSAPLVLTFFN